MENEFAKKGRSRGQENREGATTLFLAGEDDSVDWPQAGWRGKAANEPKATGRPSTQDFRAN